MGLPQLREKGVFDSGWASAPMMFELGKRSGNFSFSSSPSFCSGIFYFRASSRLLPSATLALLTTFVQAAPVNSSRQSQLVVVIDQSIPTKPAPLADIEITFFEGEPGESFDQTISFINGQDETGALLPLF